MRVVPDVPAIHRRFDYAVPAAMDAAIGIGSRVRIDLHGRRVGAWVVEDDVGPTPGVDPKPLALSSGLGPPPSVVALAEWAAWRWAGPVSSFLGTASPQAVVRGPVRPRHSLGHPTGGPDSPGGGSVDLVDAVTTAGAPTVVRLAPSLDATLVVLELLHRTGPDGVLILVPSLVRATALATRLRRMGVPVALLPDAWPEAAAGGAVVIGTRSGAWAPLGRLSAAVVLDAHDEAYREERTPTWSAVDVVVERCRRDGAVCALVSSCPPVVLTEGRSVVTTSRAVERRGWPVIEVIDRSGDDPRTGLYSERLARTLREVLDRPEGRAVCILNRTGRVRVLACTRCATLARCTRCGGAVSLGDDAGVLACGRCGQTRPAVCAACDSTRLKALRIGVTRATEELTALTGVDATELTARSDTTTGVSSRLVVGTEAALHRVGAADLVAFLDIDQHLLAPRFAAGEETLALLARAARMVGSRDGGGRVLCQTRIPDHEVLRAAVHADPPLLSATERDVRLALDLPPFGALALLRGPGAASLAHDLVVSDGVTASEQEPDRWLVRAPDHGILADALAAVPRPAERVRVAVDPTDV